MPVECFSDVLEKHECKVTKVGRGEPIPTNEECRVAANVRAKMNSYENVDRVMVERYDHPERCYPVKSGTVSSSLCWRFAAHVPTFGIDLREFLSASCR
jgi:hypothetical protein